MKRTFVKIMMASAVCVVLTVATTKTTQAQNGRFSIGAELGLPMGTFKDGYGIGFGGTLRYELPLGSNMGLTGTAGYITFSGKDFTQSGFGIIPDVTVKGPSIGMIPIQVGFKYYFQEQQNGFYGMAELGVHIASVKVAGYTDPITGATIGGGTSSSTNLSYAPEIGYHLANIDFGLRYQLMSQKNDVVTYNPVTFAPTTTSVTSTSGYLGLRVAYVFGSAK